MRTAAMRRMFLAGLFVLLSASLSALRPAQAYGLKTHIWIGQRILQEVQQSCRVQLDGVPVPIDDRVCRSLRAHPGAFLAGVLGPDAFPDLVTGQVTTHPGTHGDWQTNDWLIHVYSRAPEGPELAFAAGYLVHAASDAFAHSYVNAYAGDIFVLSDETRVELRHFLLEKYIDSRLPGYAFDPGALAPPAAWLRDKLIHDPDASRLAIKSGFAPHITAMHDLYRNVGTMVKDLDRIEEDAARLLLKVPFEIAETGEKIASGEFALQAASAGLRAAEDALKKEQAVFDAVSRALQDAISLLQQNLDTINLLGQEAKAASEAAEFARRTGKQAVDEAERLNGRLLDLERQIQGVPQYVLREVCREEVVDGICGIFCPGCGNACKEAVRTVCTIVQEVNSAWANLNGQILDLRRRVGEEQASAAKAGIDLATQLELARLKLQEQAAAQALTAGLEAARQTAQLAYDIRKPAYDARLKFTQEARRNVDWLTAELARLRKQLIDLQGVEQALADLIARSDVLSGLVKNWQAGMEIAGQEFIVASNTVAKGMLEGNSNFISTYLQWWKCRGSAYVAVPIQVGQGVCGVEDFLNRVDEEVSKIVEKTLPPPFNAVYAEYLNLRRRVEGELKRLAGDATIAFARLIAPDKTTGAFIELLARPQNASQDMMNDAFATDADSRKPLLVFARISDLVDHDMGLRNGVLDPAGFSALRNALVLSRLALMDSSGVRKLAWVFGADPGKIPDPVSPGRSSLLFDMLRSIDGNHQWQPYGLPYASAGGAPPRPQEAMARRYGYGPGQERPGFPLFVDADLRRAMFLRLFTGPLNPGLSAQLGPYPFMECAHHPFAIAFLPDGAAAADDPGCAAPPAAPPGRTPGEWFRRFLNWLHLNPGR